VQMGLGPVFNGRSCADCHLSPSAGGMGRNGLAPVLRIGKLDSHGYDPMLDRGGPVARMHSVSELGISCVLVPGIPPGANLISVRNAPALYGMGLVDTIPDAAILAGAVAHGNGIHGHPNIVVDSDGRQAVGKFGWKADVPRLELFVADALRNELGITSPLAPQDLKSGGNVGDNCNAAKATPKDDGALVDSLTAFVRSLEPLSASANNPAGSALFVETGCADCHTPALAAADRSLPLYSDLLLHNMGPALNDGVVQGLAHHPALGSFGAGPIPARWTGSHDRSRDTGTWRRSRPGGAVIQEVTQRAAKRPAHLLVGALIDARYGDDRGVAAAHKVGTCPPWEPTIPTHSVAIGCPAGRSSLMRGASDRVSGRLRFLDRFLEFAVLGAGLAAKLLQRGQVFHGLGQVLGHDIGLAKVFVRALVLRIKLERGLVLDECLVQVPRIAIGETQPVVRIRIESVPQQRGMEQVDCTLPILMLDRHHTGLIGCVAPGRSITTAATPTAARRIREARRHGNEANDRPPYPCVHLLCPTRRRGVPPT